MTVIGTGALKSGEGAGHEITVPRALAARLSEVGEAGWKPLKLRRNRQRYETDLQIAPVRIGCRVDETSGIGNF